MSQDIRSQIIHYCQRMDQKGWVANHDGNITARVSEDRFVATPTARSKADLREQDLIEVDAQGKKTAGAGSPFSELEVHLRVYRARPEVRAVVHSHAPSTMAVGCANQEMMTSAVPEAVVSLGPGIPLVGLFLPNSDEFWAEFDPLLAHYDAVMAAGNGVFSWGKTLELAFLRQELVEHLAGIFLATLPLGGPATLSSAQVSALLKKRAAAGLALPPDPARPLWFVD
ncbi:MAG: class II aldolase/adducin family protein [Deltaproteobacteria bacterium]|nr:class II aldolase/adducin family protein [Deltaproteobacteria bacterium]